MGLIATWTATTLVATHWRTFFISRDDVLKKIKQLDNKGPGPDVQRTFSMKTYKNNTPFYNSITGMTRLYNDLTTDAGAGEVYGFDCRPTAFKRSIHYVLFRCPRAGPDTASRGAGGAGGADALYRAPLPPFGDPAVLAKAVITPAPLCGRDSTSARRPIARHRKEQLRPRVTTPSDLTRCSGPLTFGVTYMYGSN
ncbi:hypothetical protein EVAR_79112_1 [Eumeta japonica]|uniref:Uncharacterized protein n=1 Tax=Eumeta variegata TaxID=151549 RepID=A0A4C1WZJ7_EUMVA|nr:hypothetical protein EVAR_79112_1 [Eumeta japonica]